MISFRTYDLNAVHITAPYFARQNARMCDLTVGVTYLWQAYFACRWAIVSDCLILEVQYDGSTYYTYPLGDRPDDALTLLEEHCAKTDMPLRFATVSPADVDALQRRYPQTTVYPQRHFFDYLYRYEDLATFAGRRYSAQRNHIHQFMKQAPAWSYQPITPHRIADAQAFLHALCRHREMQNGPFSPVEQADEHGSHALLDALPAMQAHDIPISGGMITVEDEIVAISVGEVQGDTLYVHIEKGDMRYPGVYQMMVREYAAHTPGVTYINREDDAGDEGLRRSKMAYRPCAILEKYIVNVTDKE